jgi:hypothetical protein
MHELFDPRDMDSFTDLLAPYVRDLHERVNAAIEQACEQALQGGEHGVLVLTDGDSIFIGAHRLVPYGEIHYCDKRTWDDNH